eukprot:23056-Chlamydomonas_euryale.AAC.1
MEWTCVCVGGCGRGQHKLNRLQARKLCAQHGADLLWCGRGCRGEGKSDGGGGTRMELAPGLCSVDRLRKALLHHTMCAPFVKSASP